MAEFSVSIADPRFTRAVTAYQALRRALSGFGLEEDARLQEALASIEETLVLGTLRATMPHLAARRLQMEPERAPAETPGQGSQAEWISQTVEEAADPAERFAEGAALREAAGEVEPEAPEVRMRMTAAAAFLERPDESLKG
jgi:hypothetical protein